MKDDNTKLTSIKILKDVYSSFKKVSFDSDVTLQKLVNRTVERYVTDEEWNEQVDKLFNNKWRLSKEDEETILRITNKLV